MLITTIFILYAYPLYISFCLIKHWRVLSKGKLQILMFVSFVNYINRLGSFISNTCKWILFKVKFLLSTIHDTIVGLICTLLAIIHPMLNWYVFSCNNSDYKIIIFTINFVTLVGLLLIMINTDKQSRNLGQIINFIKNHKFIFIFGLFILFCFRQILWSCFALGINTNDFYVSFYGRMLTMISLVFITLCTMNMLPTLIKLVSTIFCLIFFCYIPPLDAFLFSWNLLEKRKLSILSIKYSVFDLLFLVITFGLMQYLITTLLAQWCILNMVHINRLMDEMFSWSKSSISSLMGKLYNISRDYFYNLSCYLTKCYTPKEQYLLKTRHERTFIHCESSKHSNTKSVFGSSLKEKTFLLDKNKLHYNDLYNKIFFFKPLHLLDSGKSTARHDELSIYDMIKIRRLINKLSLSDRCMVWDIYVGLPDEMKLAFKSTVIKLLRDVRAIVPNITNEFNNNLTVGVLHSDITLNYIENICDPGFTLPFFIHSWDGTISHVETPDFKMYYINNGHRRKSVLYPTLLDVNPIKMEPDTKYIDLQAVWNYCDFEIAPTKTNPYRPFMLRQLNDTKGADLKHLLIPYILPRIPAVEYSDLAHVLDYDCPDLCAYWRDDLRCTWTTHLPAYVAVHLSDYPGPCVLLDISQTKLLTLLNQGVQILVEGRPACIIMNLAASWIPSVTIVVPVTYNIIKVIPSDDARKKIELKKRQTQRALSNTDFGPSTSSTYSWQRPLGYSDFDPQEGPSNYNPRRKPSNKRTKHEVNASDSESHNLESSSLLSDIIVISDEDDIIVISDEDETVPTTQNSKGKGRSDEDETVPTVQDSEEKGRSDADETVSTTQTSKGKGRSHVCEWSDVNIFPRGTEFPREYPYSQ